MIAWLRTRRTLHAQVADLRRENRQLRGLLDEATELVAETADLAEAEHARACENAATLATYLDGHAVTGGEQ